MARYRRSRARRFLALGFTAVLVAAIAGGAIYFLTRPSPLTPAQLRAQRLAELLRTERRYVTRAEQYVNVKLPSIEGRPAPLTPAPLFTRALPSRQVFGFVPYWTISSFDSSPEGATELSGSTVLVYSALCLGSSGAVLSTPGECQNAVADLASPSFSSFLDVAHRAGDRVLLSVETIDPSVIDSLARDPAARSETLWASIKPYVAGAGLDGVNLDIEGRNPLDRSGYVRFVRSFSAAMHAAAPSAELVVDTLPQSAATNSDFFDVGALAKVSDELFVMAYQMEQAHRSSANSPIADPDLGWSVVQTLVQYTKKVAADKLVLGLPFYGLSFETKTDRPGSPLVRSAPGAPLYLDIAAAGRPAHWDVASETPYSVYRDSGSWRQVWYDDPVSLALKSALAAVFHTAGVGVWALTMEGDNSGMLSALTGDAQPVKLLPSGGNARSSGTTGSAG